MIVGIAGIAGTLSSGIIGQRMARKSQFEQWLRESRRIEYRELLSAITTAYLLLVEDGSPVATASAEVSKEVETAKMESFRVFRDRVVIAPEVGVMSIRWSHQVAIYERDRNVVEFEDWYKKITRNLSHQAVTGEYLREGTDLYHHEKK